MIVILDGERVDPARATISIFDRGLLYGDGVFEVLRAQDTRAIDGEAHLDRLAAACAELALTAPPRATLAAWLARALADATAEGLPAARRVRIAITRGPGPLGAPLASLTAGRAFVVVEPLPPAPAAVSLAVVDWPIAPRATAIPKALAYLDHLRARELARAAGADEAIRLAPTGEVVEGATSNVFVVHGDRVATPPARGILAGLVRARVLELEPACRERPIGVDELATADEMFVTSSLRGVIPASRITLADGTVRTLARGDVAGRIAARYSLCIVGTPDGRCAGSA